MSSLDIGSGANPRGDINLDVCTGYSPHAEMIIKKPTIKADAHFLPFKNEEFNYVYCFHTLEHLNNPHKVLSEIMRVLQTHGKAIFEVPDSNIKSPSTQLHLHIHFWKMDTLTYLLINAGLTIQHAECTRESNLYIRTRKLKVSP